MENIITRRCRIDLLIPAEKALHDTIQEVEKLGASTKLTDIVVKLSEVQSLLADYVDENQV